MASVEIRCPVGPRRLLSKLLLSGEQPVHTDGNLIEFTCDDCKRSLRRRGEPVFRVYHYYDLAGTLVETTTEL